MNFLTFQRRLGQLVYCRLTVDSKPLDQQFGFLHRCIEMFFNVKDEMNGSSFYSEAAFVFFLKEIQLWSHSVINDVSFEDFCKMASQVNGISVKLCSGSEKLSIIKTFSRFVNETQLRPVDRINYRVLTATNYKFFHFDDGLNRQLKLDSDLLNRFKSLSREEQLGIFNLCADYGRSDLEWVVSNVDNLKLEEIQIALRCAARNGHLEVLKWLHETFGLTDVDARAEENYALRLSARNGHLEVLKWMHETFGLTDMDARAEGNYALRVAAENGRLEVLKWMYETFGLTDMDARAEGNYALRVAAENGRLEVLKWLHGTFELTDEDARAYNALRYAAENGRLEVLKWLVETFGLIADDARANNNDSLIYAAENGHLEVLKFLFEKFKLTADDARSYNNYALRCCRKMDI